MCLPQRHEGVQAVQAVAKLKRLITRHNRGRKPDSAAGRSASLLTMVLSVGYDILCRLGVGAAFSR
jgi:hypothetical protein